MIEDEDAFISKKVFLKHDATRQSSLIHRWCLDRIKHFGGGINKLVLKDFWNAINYSLGKFGVVGQDWTRK